MPPIYDEDVQQFPPQPPQRFFHMPRFNSNYPKTNNYFNVHQYKQHIQQNQSIEFDGKRLRKAVVRKTIDYNSAIINQLEARLWQRDYRDQRALQPDSCYYTELVPPLYQVHNSINAVTTKFVRTSTNKMRCPIFCVAWTPEGRRLVTGASSGEFTLWNGLTFNFETILQAHDSPVRCMVWSNNDTWMVTGDHSGFVKYWQSNMNNVKMFQAHKEPLRGISFCPTDQKFATCSDDGTVRVWDFLRCHEERILRGHGADVKCLDWHPQKSLLVSGSKDSQQPIKLWDPKSGLSLATLHAHKSTVMEVKWNQNGNWMLTASRDHLIKLFDIRNLNQEVQTFRGHKKEVTSISWHPIHESLFASGGSDGSIMFWVAGADKEVGAMEQAHDSIVWSLAWHPLGHILCSGSNDHSSKFWTRNRPGDKMRDKYNLNTVPGLGSEEATEYDEPSVAYVIPGMGLEHGLPDHLRNHEQDMMDSEMETPAIPGLDYGIEEHGMLLDKQPVAQKKVPYAKPIPRQFQQQWMENKRPLLAAPPKDNSQLGSTPTTEANTSDQNFPPHPHDMPSARFTGPRMRPPPTMMRSNNPPGPSDAHLKQPTFSSPQTRDDPRTRNVSAEDASKDVDQREMYAFSSSNLQQEKSDFNSNNGFGDSDLRHNKRDHSTFADESKSYQTESSRRDEDSRPGSHMSNTFSNYETREYGGSERARVMRPMQMNRGRGRGNAPRGPEFDNMRNMDNDRQPGSSGDSDQSGTMGMFMSEGFHPPPFRKRGWEDRPGDERMIYGMPRENAFMEGNYNEHSLGPGRGMSRGNMRNRSRGSFRGPISRGRGMRGFPQ